MWRTPQGTRVLVNQEARLYVTGALALREWVEDALHDRDFDADTGVPDFDGLEPGGKLVALAQVTCGLLDRRKPALALRPWEEAATYAVYATLKTLVVVEVDLSAENTLRRKIAEAYLEAHTSLGEYDTVINPDDENGEDWHSRIDTLAALVVNVERARSASGSAETPEVNAEAVEAAQKYLADLTRE